MGKQFYSLFIITLVIFFSSILVEATQPDIGTKKLDDCIDLIQSCADCTYVNFTSYTMPNGTRTIIEVEAIQSGTAFTYNSCNLTSQLGTWIIDGHGDVSNLDTVFSYTYEVTQTGNVTPDGVPMFQMGVLIIMFGVACFMLYMSKVMNEVGFKIFFMIVSLVFVMATMLTSYMISVDSNVAAAINTTTLSLITVLGSIIFIIFIYVMIRQTINVLEMLKIKRGLSWNVGDGRSVAGYNTRRPY